MNNDSKAKEQKRVDNVENIIDKQLIQTKEQILKVKSQTKEIDSSYGANTRVNTLEVDDQMETNASVQQQKQLISMNMENETILNNKESQLNVLKGSPYFGRIDIEDNNIEKFYIGTSTLQDDNYNFLIYDWRAPISSLYYNGTLGSVTYELPNKTKKVKLKLKRQFTITDGHIKNMFDTSETVGDEILKNTLGSKSSDYMKNIVATIQQEQNVIIRDTKSDVLIVQGVAGSGKTSAILQRIAYLLYHSRSQLNSDNIVMFSPNNLFSNYISQVLPSLGEKNMRQVTLDDFLSRRLYGIKVESLFERFEKDLNNLPKETLNIRFYKESSIFFNSVKNYFKNNSLNLEFDDIYFEGEVFFSAQHINKIFKSLNTRLPIDDRYLKTKNTLIKELKARIKTDAMNEWVQDELDNLDDLTFQQLLADNNIKNSEKQREFLAQKFLKERYRSIYNGIYNDFYWDPYKAYSDFLSNHNPNEISEQSWKMMIDSINQNIEYHKIRLSDAVLVLLIRDLVTGNGKNYKIQHIFIDEMQDYPISVFRYLDFSFPNAKFTLLGDFSQDIFSHHKINRLEELIGIYSDKKVQNITLNQSYRSTASITNFAKEILPNGNLIRTFNREGNKPELINFNSEKEYISSLPNIYKKLKKENDTTAIITESETRADYLFKQLKDKIDVSLISNKNRKIHSGLLILPVYLAKGLEFDAVIADNVSQQIINHDKLDVLYTIFTRAMHDLVVTSIINPSPILTKIDSSLYKKN